MSNKILICMGTSGMAAGAEDVSRSFEVELEKHKLADKYSIVKVGDRGLFRDTLVDVITPKLGRVAYEYVKPQDVSKIVEKHLVLNEIVEDLQAGDDYKQFFENQTRIVLSNCGEIDPESIDDCLINGNGYAALKKTIKTRPEDIIEEVKRSGLRGRGGAGFLTGLKWEFSRNATGDRKYIICNADEGDPGAFMDRSVLEGDPHAIIEGMIIAAYAIGASEGFIYCRAEYPLAIKRLEIAISQARQKGFLGEDILGSGFAFDISIKQGAGAFVCGEETAILASIEGNRGIPRVRPPFPAIKGLWGQPTVMNNVETLANIKHIINKGASWYASIGTENSKGTKVFALAGKIKNTGLVEVPMGTTLREIIYGAGGGMKNDKKTLKAVQIGGPSGGCIPADLIDTQVDYESITQTGAIMGSGGMVIMDSSSCMVDIARYFLSFTVEESCGQCVPCRIGLKRMLEVLDKITQGEGTQEHLKFLQNMSKTVRDASLCGLGQSAPNPILTTINYFYDEYQSHIKDKTCNAHVCVNLVKFEVDEQKCIKCGLCYKVCPAEAIKWEKKSKAEIDKNLCIKCKSCIDICPVDAIN